MRNIKVEISNQHGQGLIEVLVSLAIAIVVLSALTVAAVTSVRNATFAKNQAQANALARQAVDAIRAYRDAYKAEFFSKGSGYYGIDDANPIANSGSLAANLANVTNVPPICTNANPPTSGPCDDLGGGFYRQIYLDNTPAACPTPTGVANSTCVSINVRVYWIDSTGTQKSEITTFFGNWQ